MRRIIALSAVGRAASGPGQSFWLSAFVDPLIAASGMTRLAFSVVYLASTVISAVTASLVGRLVDRAGIRPGWWFASFGLAAGCLMASVVSGTDVLESTGRAVAVALLIVAVGLMRACGQGSFPLIATLLVITRVREREGRAMAWSNMGLVIASIAMPPIAALGVRELGAPLTFQITAGLLVLFIAPLALLIPHMNDPEARHEAVEKATHHESDADGDNGADSAAGAADANEHKGALIRMPGVALLLIMFSAQPLILTAVTVHAVDLLGGAGLSGVQAGLFIGIGSVASFVATIPAGRFVDARSTRVSLIVPPLLIAISMVILAIAVGIGGTAGLWLSWLAPIGYGLASALYAVIFGVIWARVYGQSRIGALQGLASSGQITAAAIGPLPLAISESVTGGYLAGIISLAVWAAICAMLALRFDASHTRKHDASVAP